MISWRRIGGEVACAVALAACQEKVKEPQEDAAVVAVDGAADGSAEATAAPDVAVDPGIALDNETTEAPETDVDPSTDATAEATADSVDVAIDTAPDSQAEVTAEVAVAEVAPDLPFDTGPKPCAEDCAKLSYGTPCLVGVCDNGACIGKPVTKATSCDDANDCTVNDTCCLAGDAFCKAGTCKSGNNTCECQGTDPAECEGLKGDGNACNGKLFCDTSALPFKCKLLPQSEVVCPAAPSPCVQIACQPASGQCVTKAVKQGELCPSDDPCTLNACQDGACVVETNKCECASNADCAKKDDADLCNGTIYCDKSTPGKNVCKTNPASVIQCATDGDTACAKNVCLPATGQCQMTPAELVDCQSGTCKPLPPGQPPKTNLNCEDGNKCTIGDQCGGGACKSGTQTCSCSSNADCAGQDDGDPCNGTLYCDKAAGKCKLNPATVVYCPPSASFCTKNVCKPVPGAPGQGACAIEDANEGIPCNDGVLCSAGDHCEKGQCTPTANVCLCQKDADCAKAEDGDLCNGTLLCDLSQASPKCVVNPATVVECDTPSNPCLQTICEKVTGQCKTAQKSDGASCDADGTPCTAFDACQAGTCKPGTQICACQTSSDCAKFEDGDLCNGTLYCDAVAATCKVNPATVVQCPVSLNPCQQSTCDSAAGTCKFKPLGDGEPCDADGSLCTPGDVCSGGKCVAGANLCGCLKDADCAAKEDGNVCNGTLYCDKSKGPAHCAIKPASAVTCTADDNPCTEAACDPKTGKCSNPPVLDGKACEDGKPCTLGDSCQAGKCTTGLNACNCKTNADCIDDGNPCNGVAICDKGQCVASSAVTCPSEVKGCDIQVCDSKSGACATALKACDDGNPCTVDACDPKVGGCSAKAYGDGTACGPGLACVASACVAVPDSQIVVSGNYWMGCNAAVDPQCKADEKPQHLVTILPAAIDRFEVTVGAYEACVKAGKCVAAGTGALGDGLCNSGLSYAELQPINCVNAAQAEQYCAWKGGRLPTEAEWELLARGPCSTPLCKSLAFRFPWGNLPLPGADCAMAWIQGNVAAGCNQKTTLETGAKIADKSPWGGYDLAGNVQEWTADGYKADFYGTAEATKLSPKAAVSQTRVVRGGGGASKPGDVRTSARFAVDSTTSNAWIGFRCVGVVGK